MSMQINKGDRFLPRDGKYPGDAVLVDRVARGEVSFSPLGGGFVYRAKLAKFAANYRPVTEDDLAKRYAPATFMLDDDREYAGITDGSLWNGWQCPLFERDVAIQILRESEGWSWSLDEATGALRCDWVGDLQEGEEPDPEQGYTWEPETINGRVYYGVGAWAWCWWLKPEPEEDEEDEG